MNRVSRLEVATRVTVWLSVFLALAVQIYLGEREWAPLREVAIVVFVATYLVARWSAAAAWAPVLGVAYILPVIFQAAIGRFQLTYEVVWLLPILAVILARGDWRRWSLPPAWRMPLAYWALAVALVWPLVIARETDFRWSMFLNYQMGSSGRGAPPPLVAVMVLNVSTTYLVGLLFFDALFAMFSSVPAGTFRRVVVLPLAASMTLSTAVALYQAFVDINWMSAHAWGFLGRAAGGLVDGDGYGALAGFWSALFLALGASSPLGWALGGAATLASLAGVWASGSRMALVAGVFGLLTVAYYGMRVRRVRKGFMIVAGTATVMATIALLLAPVDWHTTSPLQRSLDSLPGFAHVRPSEFVHDQLYDRGAPYGSASVWMIRHYPSSGVGIGNFYSIYPDTAYLLTGVRGDFENAQSWYRHQLAELGVLGSLGWLWWTAAMGWILLRTRGDEGHEFAAGAVKGTLVSIALVSAVSMPTQVVPTSLTVWVLAYWYVTLSSGAAGRMARPAPFGRWLWPLVWIVALVFVADTYRLAAADLRPPYRAMEANWDYHRGLYDLETPAEGPSFRWTRQNAVAVFPRGGAYLKLTFWAHHPDIAEHPVRVRFARRGQFIGDVTLTDSAPVMWYVRATSDAPRMMIESWVSRTWRPADFGEDDARELGIGLADWTFVDRPPPGAVVID